MRQTLKHFFIPHVGNNYHPHILHTKRAFFYAATCLAMKAVVFAFALLVPAQAFLLPDVLEGERKRIIAFTNDLRADKLTEQPVLNQSAELKAGDMSINQYFDHVGPRGRNLHYFLTKAGYPYEVAGENLAMGFSSAEEVIAAWKKSPTHRANLVDTDFSDIGVAIDAGEYQGIPTVYIAQHFGAPKKAVRPAGFAKKTSVKRVKGERLATFEEQAEVEIISGESKVSWEGRGKSTLISATAVIRGDLRKAEVTFNDYVVPLEKARTTPDTYLGTITIAESPESLFRVVTMPVARVETASGEVYSGAIPWERVLPVSPTPIEKYIKSKSSLAPLTNIFSVARNIYIGLFVFFALALIINILIQVRKQHPHVIVQTMALLLLIAVFIVV